MLGRVVALSGWKGSGKDTVANYLVTQYDYTQLSFAARLKDGVASTYGVPREDLDDPSRKEMPLVSYPAIPTDPFSETVHMMLRQELHSGYWTPRALCILEGSVKRSVYSNYWIRSIIQEIMDNPDKKYVISDLRYQSEADTLKMFIPESMLSLVRVCRFDTISTQDPSERNLDGYNFDQYLYNTSSMEALHAAIASLVAGPRLV